MLTTGGKPTTSKMLSHSPCPAHCLTVSHKVRSNTVYGLIRYHYSQPESYDLCLKETHKNRKENESFLENTYSNKNIVLRL
jgi:hypothetical protein